MPAVRFSTSRAVVAMALGYEDCSLQSLYSGVLADSHPIGLCNNTGPVQSLTCLALGNALWSLLQCFSQTFHPAPLAGLTAATDRGTMVSTSTE